MCKKNEEKSDQDQELELLYSDWEDTVKGLREVETILNEKLFYVVFGTLTLVLASIYQTSDLDLNWWIIIGVISLALSLIFLLVNLGLSAYAFSCQKKAITEEIENFGERGFQAKYPEKLNKFIVIIRSLIIGIYSFGVIMMAIFYLTLHHG